MLLSGQVLPVLIGPKSIQVRQNADHRFTLARFDQIAKRDPIRMRRFDHVENFVLHVPQRHHRLVLFVQHFLDGAKEVVDGKGVLGDESKSTLSLF